MRAVYAKRIWQNVWLGWLLVAVGLLGIAYTAIQWRRQSTPVPPQHQVSVAETPSAVKPSTASISNYQVPADNPKYISIPAVNVATTRVIKLGLLKNGAIATPHNVFDTGWYDASAKPGQSGTMFIFGHVSSWQAKGVFYDLKKVSRGDRIRITAGNNKIYEYRVDHTKTYPYNHVDMQQVLSPTDSTTPGLSLMTCTGKIIKGTSEFDQRLVVFANLVE